MTETVPPHAQATYQVRFDWGAAGVAAVADEAAGGVDAIVWVDQLGDEPLPAFPAGPAVVAGHLGNADAVARWALERQEALGGRFRLAVVAAGATRPDGSLRVAVEDLFASGAVIDAIADVGIDHNSPEAAAAAAAYTGLRRATRHLVSASASAREGHAARDDGSDLVVIRE